MSDDRPPEAGQGPAPESDPGAGPEPSPTSVLRRLSRMLGPELRLLGNLDDLTVLPAWRRVTSGEPRLPVSIAVLAAIALQVALPNRLAVHPRWLLPTVAALLLIGIVAANPMRIDRQSPRLRAASLCLIAVISLANVWSGERLVAGLLRGTEGRTAPPLLAIGGAIWLTNVIVFSLWYWEFDRGGPAARAAAVDPYPDFLFPQMQTPDFAPPDWEAAFVDYLYVSFTNATAFSPTDTMPLSRWAKVTMMLQSALSLAVVALVIARAVNIFK